MDGKMKVIELTRDLLKIPSPSGEEKEIGKFLAERLRKYFDVKIQNIGDESGGRFNILASKGNPNLLFTTHIDTVPGQLELKEDSEWLYGRGACDTKGIIAAMVCAAEEAAEKGFTNFGLLFDVGEELDFSGIKKAVELANPEIVVVGEPTEMKAATGQKGLIGIKIKCFGKSAPASTPEKGESAIDKLVGVLAGIMKKAKKMPSDSELGKTTISIGKIKGGTAPNVVADYADADIDIRTAKPNNEVIELVTEGVPEEIKKNMEILCSFGSVKNEMPEFVNKLGLETATVPYFTEMYFWGKNRKKEGKKAKTVVLGPGSYEFAHSDNEKIRKKELEKGREAYFRIIELFQNNNIFKQKTNNQ